MSPKQTETAARKQPARGRKENAETDSNGPPPPPPTEDATPEAAEQPQNVSQQIDHMSAAVLGDADGSERVDGGSAEAEEATEEAETGVEDPGSPDQHKPKKQKKFQTLLLPSGHGLVVNREAERGDGNTTPPPRRDSNEDSEAGSELTVRGGGVGMSTWSLSTLLAAEKPMHPPPQEGPGEEDAVNSKVAQRWKDHHRFEFKNARGEWTNLLNMSKPTLEGLMKNTSEEEKKLPSSYEKYDLRKVIKEGYEELVTEHGDTPEFGAVISALSTIFNYLHRNSEKVLPEDSDERLLLLKGLEHGYFQIVKQQKELARLRKWKALQQEALARVITMSAEEEFERAQQRLLEKRGMAAETANALARKAEKESEQSSVARGKRKAESSHGQWLA